jgi:hypothetical protein
MDQTQRDVDDIETLNRCCEVLTERLRALREENERLKANPTTYGTICAEDHKPVAFDGSPCPVCFWRSQDQGHAEIAAGRAYSVGEWKTCAERAEREVKRLAPVKSHNGKDLFELWQAAEAKAASLEQRDGFVMRSYCREGHDLIGYDGELDACPLCLAIRERRTAAAELAKIKEYPEGKYYEELQTETANRIDIARKWVEAESKVKALTQKIKDMSEAPRFIRPVFSVKSIPAGVSVSIRTEDLAKPPMNRLARAWEALWS